MMVTIMLLTDLHPFVEPLPVPERYYVIAGEDATIQDLADRSLGPVAMVDEEGTVFQLAQDLVIDETGRLTIEDCILWIYDEVSITIAGILIMDNVTIIEDPTDNHSELKSDIIEVIISTLGIIVGVVSYILGIAGKMKSSLVLSAIGMFLTSTSLWKMYYDNKKLGFDDDKTGAKFLVSSNIFIEVSALFLSAADVWR